MAEGGWCWAPRRLGRALGWWWGSRLPPAAWVLGKGEQLVTPAVPLQLFDFIAQCVHQFLAGINSPQHHLPLGFVFPFSCRQMRLDKVSETTLSYSHRLPSMSSLGSRAGPVTEANSLAMCSPQAELISWSKGFSCSDVEGKDVVQLLQAAINKQKVGDGGVRGAWLGAAPMEGLTMLSLCPPASSPTWRSLP